MLKRWIGSFYLVIRNWGYTFSSFLCFYEPSRDDCDWKLLSTHSLSTVKDKFLINNDAYSWLKQMLTIFTSFFGIIKLLMQSIPLKLCWFNLCGTLTCVA